MSREDNKIVHSLIDLCKQRRIQCCIQIGAEDGYEVNMIRETLQCRGIAIEGDTRCKSMSQFLEYHHLVIGATNCMTEFYVHKNAGLSSTFPRKQDETKVMSQQYRLDTFCENRGGIHPDALIIDTEGSAMDVLEGCGELLDGVNVVYSECQQKELRPGIRLAGEIETLLAVHGMTRHHGPPSYWDADNFNQGNYTWVRG